MAESKEEWPKITEEERIQHETLFYSQGPLNGYLTAEKARDVFLKSGLPLQVLSQIWNLADVSNDNLLNVHEFVLAMHLTLGVIQGLKPPIPLPRHLTPPKSEPLSAPLQDSEKEAYKKIFKLLDKSNSGFIEADMARDVFGLSGLSADQLARIWDIADLNRDGSLDPEEWMVACHLIRTVKKGQAVDVPVNVYDYLPDRIAPNSLQARKRRVEEYEQKKQRLMALKEKRKQDVNRENRRLDLSEQKLKLCRELYNILRKSDKRPIPPEEFKCKVSEENAEITKQEEIVYRLKKEHERVRQNTVKIILEEQKLNDDIRLLKRGTDELNKKLRAIHTKATKDPDPFHQLYEQKKEKRVTLSDLDCEEIYIPFIFDPFDAKETSQKTTCGERIFGYSDSNNHKLNKEIPDKVAVSFKNIDDSFTDIWTTSTQKMASQEQEESPFKTAKSSALDDDTWFSLHMSGDSLLGDDSKSFADLQRKLIDLKNEIQKLNMEGDRLVFKNPEDYTARKRAKEEEERAEKQRHQRRGVNGKENIKRHTFTSKTDEATQAAREYRIKRRSLNLEGGKSDTNSKESPTITRRQEQDKVQPSRSSRSQRLSTSEEAEVIEQEPPVKQPVVEKLDLSGLNNGVDEELAQPKSEQQKSEPQKIESVKSPDRALKENNFQETKTHSPERSSKTDCELPKSPEPNSPLKSPPRSTGKKTRAPAPPGTNSGPTSPRSPSSEQESPFQLSGSAKSSATSVERVTVSTVAKTSSPPVSKPSVASIEPPKAVESSIATSQSVSKAKLEAVPPKASVEESKVVVPPGPTPVAPPRRKKKDGKQASVPGQTSNSTSTPVKSAVSPEKSISSPRNSEVLSEGSTSFNTSLDNSPNRSQVAKKLNDSGITDVSFDESKGKPVILTDSLESEIFGALKGSQLFQDTDSFSNNDKTVTASPIASNSVSSPNKVKQVKQEKKSPKSETVSVTVKSEVVTKTPNGEVVNIVRNSHGGARPKVKESVKREVEQVKPDISTERNISVKREEQKQEEEEEIETVIEEVIEIHAALDQSGQPILDTNHPGYQSQVVSSKKTVFSQAVESRVAAQETKTQDTKPGSPTKSPGSPVKAKPKLEESESNSLKKSPKRKAPAPPVPESIHIQKVQTHASKIEASPSSTPPSSRVKDSKRSSIPEHMNGGAAPGYESDASDASSVPPPLPDSAPPPLPADGPPIPTGQISCEEVVEVEFKTPSISSSKSSSTGDSGIHVSSLPTSPDETDGSIQLVSYSSQSKGDNSFIRSSLDSAYDESSTLSSIEFESRGDNQTDGVTSPRNKVYNATEMVERARQFAEIVQKPNFVVKRETSSDDDFNQERLQALEMERRAVISQATVKKKFGSLSSPTEETLPQFYEETTESSDQGRQHWVLEEDENQAPDVGWTGRPDKINLYSENVVKEGDTTEEINRESIGDLFSTRQQWETILSPVAEKSETSKKQTSNAVRHWEVNFPNKKLTSHIDVQRVDSDTSNTSNTEMEPSTESAIEREIRMNMEREANLRREQEERKELLEIQKGKIDTTMYENSQKEETKPTFHELTEADRGSELWKRETIIQQELREQEEKERALRKNQERENVRMQDQPSNGQAEETSESIIEKEIRIQREREAELLQQRNVSSGNAQKEPEPVPEPEPAQIAVPEPQKDINHNQTKSVSYEQAIASSQHDGESLIARELREAREREEELQQQRQKLYNVSSPVTPSTPAPSTPQQTSQVSQQSPAPRLTPKVTNSPASWQKDVSPFLQKSKRSGSVDSLNSSHSTGRSPSDFGTPAQDEDDYKEYKPKPETPIEREIRLARERENELRRSKGLPDIPEPKRESSGPPSTPVSSNDTPRYSRSYYGDGSNTMKKYSSSRLQQEIIKQKERELDLRKEGKIITTSEEHIEPLKYVAVTGQETTSAGVKKNFVTRKSSSGLTPSKGDETDGSVAVDTTPKSMAKADILKNRKVTTAGGAGFSYKESRNTAESKIERELREMREREEELRKQRSGAVSSQGEETPNGV